MSTIKLCEVCLYSFVPRFTDQEYNSLLLTEGEQERNDFLEMEIRIGWYEESKTAIEQKCQSCVTKGYRRIDGYIKHGIYDNNDNEVLLENVRIKKLPSGKG